jgi:hypothetical protein
VKHFLDKPPFPGRLVLDIHQSHKVVADFDVAFGAMELFVGFGLFRETIDFGHEAKAAGLVRFIGKLRYVRAFGKRHFSAA